MFRRAEKYYIVFLCAVISLMQLPDHGIAQSLGDGRDGSPSISGVVNYYTPVINIDDDCSTISVKNGSGFSAGDLILIIQMQGARIDESESPSYGEILDFKNAGNFEFVIVESVNGNNIYLKYALTGSYTISGKVQLIKVPQYVSPVITNSITCAPWNGKTGGVVVIDATQKVVMNADINVIGKGFRGGIVESGYHQMLFRYEYRVDPDKDFYSAKGEGIAGFGAGNFTSGRGAPANGGGGGNVHTSGGGGGSNYGCGGDGGWGYPADTPLGAEKFVYGLGGDSINYVSAGNKLFMGGGGGAGHSHFEMGTSGAEGGGIVIILSDEIDGNDNNIFARGGNSASSGELGDGTGGAGGGGSILLSVNNFSSNLKLDLSGGTGGSSISVGFGPGGGGGGGMGWLSVAALPANVTLSLDGGPSGLAGGIYYGGSDGCDGGMFYNANFTMGMNTTIPAMKLAFDIQCRGMTTILIDNNSKNISSYLWDFGDGTTDSTFNPIHSYEVPGIYAVKMLATNSIGCTAEIYDVSNCAFSGDFAFTPNGDGVNDHFSFFNTLTDDYEIEFLIYNRWGNVIFEGNSENYVWDGTYMSENAPIETYVYVLKTTRKENEQSFTSIGTITLIR